MMFTKENRIESAIITGSKEISVKLSVPAKNTETTTQQIKLVDKDGIIVLLKDVKPIIGQKYIEFPTMKSNFVLEYIITTVNDLELLSSYTVSKVGYEKLDVSVGNIYDTNSFKDIFTYTNNDLGAVYKEENTTFKVWSPLAKSLSVLIFENGDKENDDNYKEKYKMNKDKNGVWSLTLMGDYKNKYYLYEVNIFNKESTVADPYAKAVAVNGVKSMIVDLKSTDPEGFKDHKKPKLQNPTDAIIYELRIRDLSLDSESNIKNKGKFLSFKETGTKNSEGLSTGIDHIKELGITHVNLFPCFDFYSINEKILEKNEYDWTYDENVRIKEVKEMIMALHENDLRVVIDVAYSPTYSKLEYNLNTLVPNYYYRLDENGDVCNVSGCGNEIASEREMARKLIIDSVIYWATEYNVDGFRFDLMRLIDTDTMNMIRQELNKIDETILVYGEGFETSKSQFNNSLKSTKKNINKLDKNIAIFNDDMIYAIRGNVLNEKEKGFVSGSKTKDNDIKFGIVGGINHPQINISDVNYASYFFATSPTQTINYTSSHYNITLWDKLLASTEKNEQLVCSNKLSVAIIFTSQGIPFFQAGEEIARTKNSNNNDIINSIKWETKGENIDLFEYYKGLISLRKKYNAFRLTNSKDVISNIRFLDTPKGLIAYNLKNKNNNDYKEFMVIFNSTQEEQTFKINAYADVLVNESTAGTKVICTLNNEIVVKGIGAYVLGIKDESDISITTKENLPNNYTNKFENIKLPIISLLGIVCSIGLVRYFFRKKK